MIPMHEPVRVIGVSIPTLPRNARFHRLARTDVLSRPVALSGSLHRGGLDSLLTREAAQDGVGNLVQRPSCGMNAAMTHRARFYFWYYAFPKPLAEEGLRSV